MRKFNIKTQIHKLYTLTMVGYFRIAGASWVALLALRGFSLLEIGVLESIFHIVSSSFEIPSGVAADVFGRKRTMVLASLVSLVSGLLMIWSYNFATVAFAIGFSALSYNLESGTREALAYDSLKFAGREEEYNKFASTEMMLYRITSSTATLCAGFALWLGYRRAYLLDIFFSIIAIGIACSLKEVSAAELGNADKDDHGTANAGIRCRLKNVITESWQFMITNKRARGIMVINALIGAVSTLVLFFLQAKLPLAGLKDALLGPALFVMGLGAALGAKVVGYFPGWKYGKYIMISGAGVIFAFAMIFTGKPYLMDLGGFIGSFSDDFLEVRTDIILNEMIPSEQRATLISVNSFMFSLIMIVMSTLMGSVM
ncbi:MAG: MFS transporter [Agathobacter sp.]|nr:MFS transporter [Agathobacter sp.]